MFDIICSIPLDSDVFAQATHPTEPVISVGTSAGHVQTFRLPSPATASVTTNGSGNINGRDSSPASETGFDTVTSMWKARRCKGSCRNLAYSPDGEVLCSAGSDGIIKLADSETGRVSAKIRLPHVRGTQDIDPPTTLQYLSTQALLVGTDEGRLSVFDLRENLPQSKRASNRWNPHDDYISSITPIPQLGPNASGLNTNKWVTTGGTTLAVTDLRKGVLRRSEDQEDELLSSVFVTGLSKRGTNRGEKVVVGTSTGVLTLWENGVWDDQDERIKVDDSWGASLDCVALAPEDIDSDRQGRLLVVGLWTGAVKFVNVGGQNGVVHETKHDDAEGVTNIDFDVTGRMITGGGPVVRVWSQKRQEDRDDGEAQIRAGAVTRPRTSAAAEAQAQEEEEQDSDEDDDDYGGRRSKRRKKGNSKKGRGANPLGMTVSFAGLD